MAADESKTKNTTSQNGQVSSSNQGTARWPSVDTSTSENMSRLQISKSEEFDRIIKQHPKS